MTSILTNIARRPTLIIGYGRFGLKVMEQLLYNASMRDVLVWESKNHKASVTDRHLRDLALLHIKDRFQKEQQHTTDNNSGDEFEMFQDLYSQIKALDYSETAPEESFAKTVADVVATQLLSASTRGRRDDDTLPLGLDIVVLLHPEDAETVGFLNRLLQSGIERIINENPNLCRGTQQSSTLTCIKIIDFDNYWETAGGELRKAIFRSVSFWQKRRDKNKPGFERIYFVDGRPRYSTRDETHRISEVSLFLEFLLFEGQRSGDLERLYKTSAGPHEQIVGSFGIRVIEHNTALLRSLASAWFCVGWLDYMARTTAKSTREQPETLRENLRPYLPDKLETILGKDELKKMMTERFSELEKNLLALSPDDQAWPLNMRETYEQTQKQLESELSEAVHQRVKSISETHLAKLSHTFKTSIHTDLHNSRKTSIHTDLHNSREPVTLSAVIEEINSALQVLEQKEGTPSSIEDTRTSVWKFLSRQHARYLNFNLERLHVEAHKQWWPMAALMLSLGATPLVTSTLEDVPKPDKTQTLLLTLHDLLQTLNNPVFVSIVLFVLAWQIGRTIFQKRVRLRVEWGKGWWQQGSRQHNMTASRDEFEDIKDPQKHKKGRLVAYVRKCLEPDGVLRQPLEAFAQRLLDDMALSVRAEVRRELRRINDFLSERKREVIWLEAQLNQYLIMHHLNYNNNALEQQTRLGRETTDVRYSVEDVEDFKEILRVHPSNTERYRSAQSEVGPFEKWDNEYNENGQGFLYPIEFIENVANKLALNPLHDPELKLTQKFNHFLSQRGNFGPAFRWPPSEGVSVQQRYCVLPQTWKRLDMITSELSSAGIANTSIINGHDDSRTYLLRIQTGIDVNCLVEQNL